MARRERGVVGSRQSWGSSSSLGVVSPPPCLGAPGGLLAIISWRVGEEKRKAAPARRLSPLTSRVYFAISTRFWGSFVRAAVMGASFWACLCVLGLFLCRGVALDAATEVGGGGGGGERALPGGALLGRLEARERGSTRSTKKKKARKKTT